MIDDPNSLTNLGKSFICKLNGTNAVAYILLPDLYIVIGHGNLLLNRSDHLYNLLA
ncbi:hypothetical protein D3C76_1610340 [compost metagenome]